MASPQHEDAQLALEKLRSAVQSDRVGNEAAALQLYVEATGGLFRVIKAETNAERKAKWTAQLTQYVPPCSAQSIAIEALPARLARLPGTIYTMYTSVIVSTSLTIASKTQGRELATTG